jgi:hypothetical protein
MTHDARDIIICDMTTPSEKLRMIAKLLEELADELDGHIPQERLLDTQQAAKFLNKSTSWFYQRGEEFGLGRKLPSGSFVWSLDKLTKFKNSAD